LQERHAKLRTQAIEIAKQRIQNAGLASLNARFVAKAVGCSVGTLYNIFKNIDFLIFEVNLNTLASLEDKLDQAAKQSPNPTQAIQAIAQTYIQFSTDEQNLWLTLFEHRFPNPLDTPEDYYKQRHFLFRILEQQFALLHPQSSAHDIAIEARSFWAGVHGICTLHTSDKLDDDGQTIQDITNMLITKFITPTGSSL
jgi:AcrR family transcriptional regulator